MLEAVEIGVYLEEARVDKHEKTRKIRSGQVLEDRISAEMCFPIPRCLWT